jgi:hypothetical protein
MPRLKSHRDIHPHRARLGMLILAGLLAAFAGLTWGQREAADQIVEAVNAWTNAAAP